jgi:hypothetical protein
LAAQTENRGYPAYFEPHLSGPVFAAVVQLGAEISPTTQKLLSSKILMWIFPHTFTIYLFHGLIPWILEAPIVVQLSVAGVPYWAVMLVNAAACWGTLFLVLPVVTPTIEILGKGVMEAIWRFGIDGSVKNGGALWPCEKELLLGRSGRIRMLVRMRKWQWIVGLVLMVRQGMGEITVLILAWGGKCVPFAFIRLLPDVDEKRILFRCRLSEAMFYSESFHSLYQHIKCSRSSKSILPSPVNGQV